MAPRRVLSRAELADQPVSWPVLERRVLGSGSVSDFVDELVSTPSGTRMRRQFTLHPGAVGIIAWNEDDQVAVVRQYRHPVGYELVEPPAGLLDHGGEAFLVAAQRELAEVVGLAASDWRVLLDIFTSPGASAESLRVYLARGLSHAEAPADFEAEGEEVEMESCWAARAELLDAIYSGDLQNPIMIAGLLALETARISGRLDELRPADAPWPARAVVAAPPSSALPSRCSPTARSTSNLSALPLSQ